MPHTVAPDLSATDLSTLLFTVAGSVRPARTVGGLRKMRAGSAGPASSDGGVRARLVANGFEPSLQLPVLAADRADAHALEALGDRVAEEAQGLDAPGEEVAVEHRAAARRVVLVHDLEQALLERADPVGLRPRVALLAIVGRLPDAPVLHGSAEARRAHAQARRGPDALVHRDAAGMRTRGLGQRRVGLERQRRDERGVVEQAVLRVQDDVRGQRA